MLLAKRGFVAHQRDTGSQQYSANCLTSDEKVHVCGCCWNSGTGRGPAGVTALLLMRDL